MSARVTRRQAAKARDPAASSSDDEATAAAPDLKSLNGDGNGNGSARQETQAPSDEPAQENIFLFWPNIIGS